MNQQGVNTGQAHDVSEPVFMGSGLAGVARAPE